MREFCLHEGHSGYIENKATPLSEGLEEDREEVERDKACVLKDPE